MGTESVAGNEEEQPARFNSNTFADLVMNTNTHEAPDESKYDRGTFVEARGEKKIGSRAKKVISSLHEGDEQLLSSNMTAKFTAVGQPSLPGSKQQSSGNFGSATTVEEKVGEFRVVSFRNPTGLDPYK